jgi:UDP-N-acetylglucosamine 2-epimerase
MILLSFGTRPEWIKIKPLLDQMDGNIPYRLLFTGQHVDLLSKVGKDKDLVKLEIKDGPNRLDSIVSSVMNLEEIFEGVTSVLVQGRYDLGFLHCSRCFSQEDQSNPSGSRLKNIR